MAKTTFEIDIDAVLKLDKILNAEEFQSFLTKEIQKLAAGTTDVTPVISLDPESVKRITDEMTAVNTEIEQQRMDHSRTPKEGYEHLRHRTVAGTTPEGVFQPAETVSEYKSRLRRLDDEFAAIGNYFRGRATLNAKEFQSPAFQESLTALGTGSRIDPVTGQRQVITAKNIDRLIGPGTLAKIKEYQAALQLLTKQLTILQAKFQKTTGIAREPITVTKGEEEAVIPAVGSKAADHNVPLQVLLNDLKGELSALKGSLDASTAKARQDADLKSRERASLEKDRETAERAARVARIKESSIGSRAISAAGGDPTKVAAELRPVSLVRLNRELEKVQARTKAMTDRLGKLAHGTKPFERLTKRAAALEAQIRDVNAQLRGAKTSAEKLSKTKIKPKVEKPAKVDKEAGLQTVGEEIIRRAGGDTADVATIARRDLKEVEAALSARLKKGTAEMNRMALANQQGTDSYKRLSAGMQRTSDQLVKLRQRMRGFGTVTQQTSALFRQFFRYAIGYGALYQALAAVRALVGGVVDLQKALKSIQAVTGATVAEMETVAVGIREIALSTKFSTNEIADAARILGQAGVEPKDFTNVLRSVATFAAATESSIETAADLVSTMRNVFTDLNDQTIANQLTKAINISKLTSEDLKTILSRGAQVAKGYNLSADQFLAGVTVLRNAGIKASTVATGFRQGLIELLSPDEKTLKVLKSRYAQLGESLSIGAIQARFFGFQQQTNPLLGVLREYERLGFTGGAEAQFQRVFDVRAVNAIKALIDNIEQLPEAELKLNFGDAALKASQTQMESLANSTANLGAAITALSHQMAGPLVESLEDVVDGATDVLIKLNELDLRLKTMTGSGLGESLGIGLAAGAASAATGAGSSAIGRAGRFIVGGAAGTVIGARTSEEVAGTGAPAGTSAVAGVAGTLLLMEGLRAVYSLIKGIPSFLSRVKGVETVLRNPAFIGPTMPALTGFFRAVTNWFAKIPLTRLKALGGFLRAHPFGSALGVLIGIMGAVNDWLKPEALTVLKNRFAAARESTDAAVSAYAAQLQEFDEFRLSSPGNPASADTTAATVEDLGEGVAELDARLADIFGNSGATVAEVRRLLIDLNTQGAEAGSALRKSMIENIEDIAGISFKGLGLSDRDISQMAAASSDQQRQADAFQDEVRRHIIQIHDTTEDLTAAQEAFLASYTELARDGEVFGELTGLVDSTPDRMFELMSLLLSGMVQTDAAVKSSTEAAERVLEAQNSEIKLLAETLLQADSPEMIRTQMLRLQENLDSIGSKVEDYITNLNIELARGALSPEAVTEVEGPKTKIVRRGLATEEIPIPETRTPLQLETDLAEKLQEERDEQALIVQQNAARVAQIQRPAFEEPGAARGPVALREAKQELVTSAVYLEQLNTALNNIVTNIETRYIKAREQGEKNERFDKQQEARRESALKVIKTKAFKDFIAGPDINPRTQKIVASFDERTPITQFEKKPGDKTGVDKEVTPEATILFSAIETFFKQKYEPKGLRTYQVNAKRQEKIDVLRTEVAKAEKHDLSRVRVLREQLYEEELKQLREQQDVYASNIEAAEFGGKGQKREAAEKKYLETVKKASQLEINLIKNKSEDELELRRRSREQRTIQSHQEKLTIDRLEQEQKRAEREDPRSLTATDDSNVAVRAAKARIKYLDRLFEIQAEIATDDQEEEKVQIKARAEAEKIYTDRVLEQRKLKTFIEKEIFDLTKKELVVQKQILTDQLQNVDRSLDFAYEIGNAELINKLTAERIEATKELLAVERRQMDLEGASEEKLALFDRQASRRIELMRRELELAEKTLAASRQRLERLRTRPSEFGDFEETGRLRARGTPLSSEAQATVISANIDIQNLEIDRIQADLDRAKKKLEQGLKANADSRTAEEVIASGDRGVQETDEELQSRLENVQKYQNELDSLKETMGEMSEEYLTLTDGMSKALQDGFNFADLAKRLQSSSSAVKNLGNTIQEDLVAGMEAVGDSFADTLVDGQNFTEGFSKAMSDMLNQIAKDIIKSQVTSLITNMFAAYTGSGGAKKGGLFSNFLGLFSKGGTVEAKAEGGVVGSKSRPAGGIIKGPGTGTSDSIPGVVTDARGKPRRGILVSNGESILNQAATTVLGSKFINYMNKSVSNAKQVSQALYSYLFENPEKKAKGGMIAGGDTSSAVDKIVAAMRTGTQDRVISTLSRVEKDTLSNELRTRTDTSSQVVREYLKSMGVPVEKYAAGGTVGGVAKGPGTGISDSMRGTILTPAGEISGVLAFSDGEGILTAKATEAVGHDFVHMVNKNPQAVAEALSAGAPLKMATGGIIGDASRTVFGTETGHQEISKKVAYSFNSDVSVNNPDGELPASTLRLLDRGMNTKIREYVETQLRPGGLLQGARG